MNVTNNEIRADAVSALTEMATVINSGGSDDDIKRAWLEVNQNAFELFVQLGIEIAKEDTESEEKEIP